MCFEDFLANGRFGLRKFLILPSEIPLIRSPDLLSELRITLYSNQPSKLCLKKN